MMTLTEVDEMLALAKTAYKESFKGTEMSWQGRTIKLKDPEFYIREINRLDRMKIQLSSTRKGHNISLANFNNTK